MVNEQDPTLARLKRAATAAGASRRSPLRRWLEENRSEFGRMLAEAGRRPNWAAMAKVLADRGLTGSDGQPPTAKLVSLVWWKVSKGQDAPRAPHEREGGRAPLPVQTAAPAPPSAPVAEQPRRTFRPAGGDKDWTT